MVVATIGTRRAARVAAAAAALGVLLVLLGQLAALRGQDTDLFPRWYGLRQLLLHGRNPYGDDVSREIAHQIWFFDGQVSTPDMGRATPLEAIYGFLYPLPGALLLAPLALLPYPAAYALWVLSMLVTLPAAAWLAMDAAATSTDVSGNLAADLHRRRFLLAAPLALCFLPSWANVMLGQPAPAVAFLTALAVWLSRRRPLVAGAALAAAALLKPHLLALVAPLWLVFHAWRWWRGERTAGAFVGGVALAAAILAGAAWALVPTWLQDFARAAHDYVAVGPGAAAVLVAARIALPEPLAWGAAAGATVVVGGWALAAWRAALGGTRQDEVRALWRTVVATALVVPPAWETNAVMLLLPLAAAVVAQSTWRRAAALTAGSAALTFLLLPPYFVLGWQRGTLVIAAYLAGFAAASTSGQLQTDAILAATTWRRGLMGATQWTRRRASGTRATATAARPSAGWR